VRAGTCVKDLANEDYIVLLKCSRELIYFAVEEGSKPFAFWNSSIAVDPETNIVSLQDELTRKYSSSRHCLATVLYKVSSVHVDFYRF
jgi:hypothetical protein